MSVLGLSIGGRVAAILASGDSRVRFAILYSAALGPLRKKFHADDDRENLENLCSGESVKIGDGWYLKKLFFETVDDPVPLECMHRIIVSVLLIHIDMDQVVPMEHSRKGYAIIKNLDRKNEFYVVKNGDHPFQERRHTNEVIKKTIEWLRFLDQRNS